MSERNMLLCLAFILLNRLEKKMGAASLPQDRQEVERQYEKVVAFALRIIEYGP